MNRNLNSDEKAVYAELTREQLLALLEASKTVEAEAPKGLNQLALLTENGSQNGQK